MAIPSLPSLIPTLLTTPPDDQPQSSASDMPPHTRTSSEAARLNSTAAKNRRKNAAEQAYADAMNSKERTKRGCWTCRIRRKKCDEEQIDGRCKTCRRLCLECLGWGTKRPEWMKDKQAVDDKKAQIKHQLATQGMIRGQAKNPNRQPNSQNNSNSPYLSIPKTSISLGTQSSPPSIDDTPLVRTRHERAAKTQANAALNQQQSPPSARGISPTSDDDGSGSDEDDYDSPQDSEMTPADGGTIELPRIFDSSAAATAPGLLSSTATPSFSNSPLQTDGAFVDSEHGFSSAFSINGLGDTALDNVMTDAASLSAYGNPVTELMAMEDPYGHLDLGADFDIYASFGAFPQPAKDYNMSIAVQTRTSVPELNRSQSLSPPILSASTTTTSPGNSPTVGTTSQATSGRQPSPKVGLGISVTSPTGLTMPATGFPFVGMMPDSYFPAQSAGAVASPVLAIAPNMAGPPPPASVAARARQNTAASLAAGFFPQPSPQYTTFIPPAAQTHPALGAYTIAYKPTIRTPLTDPTRSLSNFQETLVFYYFNRGVRRMQYLLADDSTTGVTDVMYDLVIRDPLGPVTNAICSLASLHDTRKRIAEGLVHPEDPHAHDNAQKLYSDTVVQLSKKSGKFTSIEAIAALHLLSFWLFCGGGGNWASALGMAGDWLMCTEIMNDNADPIEVIEKWPPTHRFAAQATLWFDILGSCSLHQSPRFLKLYRRMAARNRGLAAAGPPPVLFGQPQKPNAKTSELMNQVMGCDDEIMLALAEIADLAAWKAKHQEKRTLSYRELVKRGRVIEEQLNSTKVVMSPLATTSAGAARGHNTSPIPRTSPQPGVASAFAKAPPVWNPYQVNPSTSLPTQSSAEVPASDPSWLAAPGGDRHRSSSVNSSPGIAPRPPSSTSSVTGTPGPLSIITTAEPVTLRQLCSNVFREAAFLFLHSVVSGPEPGVPEIRDSVASLMNSIMIIPSEDLDRSLAFPITIGGCLSEKPEHREFFSGRLTAQGSAVGNGSQAKLLMETVWKRRDAGEKGVCWRDTMKQLGFDLLLV